MSNIQEQIYIERLKQSSEAVKKYIYGIYSNSSFSSYIQKYRNSSPHKEEEMDVLRNEISLLLLKIITIDEFVDKVVETLDIQPSEAEDMINDFFSLCLPLDLQNIIENIESEEQNHSTEKIKIEDTNTISHVDILSEIENPTPSMSTTADFTNSSASINTTPTIANTNTNSSQTKSVSAADATQIKPQTQNQNAPTNPLDLGGFGITPTNTENPAQNIANKLDQNLSAATNSIPKEIYVSKRPDPYHEPII